MNSLFSIIALLLLTTWLSNLDRITWPPQRHSALYDQQYWTTVQRDTAAYLATHTHVDAEIRRNVEAMATAAQQRLEGLAR